MITWQANAAPRKAWGLHLRFFLISLTARRPGPFWNTPMFRSKASPAYGRLFRPTAAAVSGATAARYGRIFWALAALKAGREDLFAHELSALARHAVRDGQFAEIYHPVDGRIYGGIQDGGGEYLEWHSCEKQTWSASALIAMILYGLFMPEAEKKELKEQAYDQ